MGDPLQDALARIESAQNETRRSEELLAQSRQALRDALREGKTTGDPVSDFLLLTYGPECDPEVEKKYRGLADRFRGKKDSPVLIVKSHQEPTMCSAIHQEGIPTYSVHSFELGVLGQDPSLDIQQGAILLPTKPGDKPRHAHYGGRFSGPGRRWELNEGNMFIAPHEFAPSARATNLLSFSHPRMERFLGLYLGDEIEEWLAKPRGFVDHEAEESELGFGLLGTGLSEIVYAEGLQLLGAPLPTKTGAAYTHYVGEQRKHIIGQLTIYMANDLSQSGNGSDSPAERGRTQSLLEQAIKFGLHRDEEVLEPRPGMSVKIRTYIADLCSRYGVSLPETSST